MIRAKVEMLRARIAAGAQAEAARDEARAYFELAREFLAPTAPRLVAIGGLSGSGKSAVARARSRLVLGAFPGSRHCAKRCRAQAPVRRRARGTAAGSALMRQRSPTQVYAMCRKRALLALLGGQAVIVDAVQAKPEERAAMAALAAQARRSLHRALARSSSASSCGRGWRRAKAMCPTRRLPWSMSSSATRSARKASQSSMQAARSIRSPRTASSGSADAPVRFIVC